MINPINEMKKDNVIDEQTEIMVAQTLNRELKGQHRLTKMRTEIHKINQAKSLCPPKAYAPLSDSRIEKHEHKKEALLNWAKAHYRDYKDVIVGANTLDMPPGVVYSLLKQHDFIKKTDTTEYRVMMAYFKYNGRLCDIVKETGLTVWIVAKTIEALGYSPRWQEYRNSRYVSKVGVAGVGAEEKFKQLVPDAVDMNEEYRENNRDFDFIVHEKTVDVKEMTPLSPKGRNYSFFEFKCYGETHPDFYCLFLCYDKEKRINGHHDILLIPSVVIPQGKSTITINVNKERESHQFWYQFQVDPAALSYVLGERI